MPGCRITGFTPNYVFESDNPSMLRSMIDEEIGIVFFPEVTWGAYDGHKHRLVDIRGKELVRKIVAQKFKSNAPVDEFYEILKAKLAALKK